MNEAERRVARAMRKLDMSGNMAMSGMAFIDDLAMVGGTDESYDNPDTFDEAWEHPNISERKYWREAIRKEFNDMIKRQVWRETDIDQIPSNRRLIGSKWVFKKKRNGVYRASFEVSKGEMLVVMGLSGSGKSTLLRCISRLTDATGGKIFIEGQDLLSLNNKELIDLRRNKMGMAFQSFALLPHKTVVENIAFPLQIKGIKTEDSIAKAMNMVKLVGLDGRENYFPRELSGGQQQRVGIARSLAVEPDIWFLDEPFSALDPLIRKEMQDEFLRLQEKLQKTIMFITHDFDEALKLADRIAIMKDGIIEQLDTPANIVLNPATEYVKKFTEEVPREKVLTIEDVMDKSTSESSGDFKVLKDEIIENVAEKILTQEKTVSVVDQDNKIVGSINPSKIIQTVFGGRKNHS